MRVQLVLFYGICLALVTLSHHKRSLGSRLLILCRVLNFVQPGETFEVLVLGYQFRHHLFDFFLSWKGLLLLAFLVHLRLLSGLDLLSSLLLCPTPPLLAHTQI